MILGIADQTNNYLFVSSNSFLFVYNSRICKSNPLVKRCVFSIIAIKKDKRGDCLLLSLIVPEFVISCIFDTQFFVDIIIKLNFDWWAKANVCIISIWRKFEIEIEERGPEPDNQLFIIFLCIDYWSIWLALEFNFFLYANLTHQKKFVFFNSMRKQIKRKTIVAANCFCRLFWKNFFYSFYAMFLLWIIIQSNFHW